MAETLVRRLIKRISIRSNIDNELCSIQCKRIKKKKLYPKQKKSVQCEVGYLYVPESLCCMNMSQNFF